MKNRELIQEEVEKKVYSKPLMSEFGKMLKVTQSHTGSSAADFGGGYQKQKGG